MINKIVYINTSIKSTIDKLKTFKLFLVFSLIIVVSCYGFSLFNTTISVDDLALSMYLNGDISILAGCRWGTYVIIKLFGVSVFSPFIMKIIGLFFFALSVVFLMTILNKINGNSDALCLYAFGLTYISFPLINELYEYSSAFLSFSVCLFLISLVLLSRTCCNNNELSGFLIEGLVIAPAMAGYESTIFVYISMVLVILFIKNNNRRYNWVFDGFKYVPQLVIAFVLRYAIGFAIIKCCNLDYAINGSGMLVWGKADLLYIINQLKYNLLYYVVRADIYMPILEFLLSILLITIIEIKSIINNKSSLILLLLIIISVFGLSLLQGSYMAYRTAQTIQLFVSFVVYDFVCLFENKFILGIHFKPVLVILIMLLLLRQSVYLHNLLSLNNQRSNNEASVAQNIGYRLYSEYDISKKVIFCGEYQLGDFINNQIIVSENNTAGKFEMLIRKMIGHNETKYYDEFVKTNVNSILNWNSIAFNSQIMMREYLSYYGYDIKVVEEIDINRHDWIEKYELIAKENQMKPLEIKDMGSYILVYFGPTIDR